MSPRCTVPLLARPAQVQAQRGRAAGAVVRHGAAGTGQQARGSWHGAAGTVRGARWSTRDLRPGVPEGAPNTTEGLWALENLFGSSESTSLARIRLTNASSPTY